MSFSPLILTYNPDNDPFLLHSNFIWWHHGLPGGKYVVRAGQSTDLASIPIGMRNLFDRLGPSVRAAIVHDDMCRRQWETRKKADDMFYRALLDCGMSRWKAKLYHRGVRVGAMLGIGGNW